MSKLEQAARQAIKDLRYAIQEMSIHASRVGPQHSWWDVICDFDITSKLLEKALAEQAEQEPFDMNDHPPHRLCECRKCMEYFTPLPDCDAFAASGKPITDHIADSGKMVVCRHCGFLCKPNPNESRKWYPLEQAEQEPVAIIEKEAGFETEVYATGYADSLPDGVFKLYAAPVSTKDLTDTELMDCRSSDPAGGSWLESARAVIAKFKEKNRG